MKLLPMLFSFVFTSVAFAQSLNTDTPLEIPTLRIVELVAKGSVETSEFGTKSDWLKLENFGNDTIHLSEHKIYITDDSNRLKKFRLRKKTIAPKSSLIIWCDDNAVIRDQIHTNFKLSSRGETVTLTLVRDSQTEKIDQVYYNEVGKEAQHTLFRSESNMLVYSKGL
jgi:hypothetical protein